MQLPPPTHPTDRREPLENGNRATAAVGEFGDGQPGWRTAVLVV